MRPFAKIKAQAEEEEEWRKLVIFVTVKNHSAMKITFPIGASLRGRRHFLLSATLLICLCAFLPSLYADTPEQGWLKPYVNGRGLAFEYSSDNLHWQTLGGGRTFVDSDFGTWGAEKKMADPCLFLSDDGLWTLMWIPNPRYDQYAICTSPDLIHWKPQDYPPLDDSARRTMETRREPAILVPWSLIEQLREHCEYLDARDLRHAETLLDDDTRFASLQPFGVHIAFDAADSKAISDKLIGVFFEDISWGADGGLYGELIQNRDFEYTPDDVKGRNAAWGPLYAWSTDKMTAEVLTDDPIHPHNPHYVRLTAAETGATFTNSGYDGIPVKKGEEYFLTFFGKKPAGGAAVRLTLSLQDADGNVAATSSARISSEDWQKKELTLKASADMNEARLVVTAQEPRTFCLDMVSLFPRHTFKAGAAVCAPTLHRPSQTCIRSLCASPEAAWPTATDWTTCTSGKTPSERWRNASPPPTSGATTRLSDWDIWSTSSSARTSAPSPCPCCPPACPARTPRRAVPASRADSPGPAPFA